MLKLKGVICGIGSLFIISNRLRRYSNSLRSSTPATQESVIQRLDSTLAAAMAKKIGIPPGLVSCFELEMARLQVMNLTQAINKRICLCGILVNLINFKTLRINLT